MFSKRYNIKFKLRNLEWTIRNLLFLWLIFKGDTHIGGSSREGSFKETITLKWCTPRTNNIGRCFKRFLKCFNFCFTLFYSFKKQVFSSYGNISLYSFKSVFSSISELHYCTGAYRISPVDVNSRPSSCLTNFLLNGNFHRLIVWLRLLQVNH